MVHRLDFPEEAVRNATNLSFNSRKALGSSEVHAATAYQSLDFGVVLVATTGLAGVAVVVKPCRGPWPLTPRVSLLSKTSGFPTLQGL